MKIAKRAVQINFMVDETQYTPTQIEELIERYPLNVYWQAGYSADAPRHVRVSKDSIKEIKVVLSINNAYYENVTITHEGEAIHIVL